MKKLMTLAAMLALVLAMAVPAIAQVSQGEANRSTTGAVTLNFTAQSTGNNSSQCVTPLQFGNTAPQQNTQGALQYASNSGGVFGIDLTGPEFTVAPTLTTTCNQAVQQSSAASSSQYPTLSGPPVAPVSSPSP